MEGDGLAVPGPDRGESVQGIAKKAIKLDCDYVRRFPAGQGRDELLPRGPLRKGDGGADTFIYEDAGEGEAGEGCVGADPFLLGGDGGPGQGLLLGTHATVTKSNTTKRHCLPFTP
ncbi:MAG: hypothetical protein QXY39_05580 [Thermofilaceae archaeon]